VLSDCCATAEYFYSGEDGSEQAESRASLHLRPCCIGRAHQGMLEGARGVAKTARSIVEQELNHLPDYNLVVVGHSLGGGVASVLAALWKEVFPGVVAYSFGSPCVFPEETDEWLCNSIYSVVGEGDPFSKLSLGHVADLSQGISFLCEDEMLRKEILSRSKGPIEELDDANIQWLYKTMNRMLKRMSGELLYPPGRILLMRGVRKDASKEVTLQVVDRAHFNVLTLHPKMFDLTQHVPGRYENELRHLWNEYKKQENFDPKRMTSG
jgi:pimeloyl-ACP methyl ester carboxylesterase